MTKLKDKGRARCLRGHDTRGKHPVVKEELSQNPDHRGKVLVTAVLHQDAYGPNPYRLPGFNEKNRYAQQYMTYADYFALPECTYTIDKLHGTITITGGDRRTLEQTKD
jgi:hypothetical protein